MPFQNNTNNNDFSTKDNVSQFPRAKALSSMENKGSLEVGESSFRVYYGTTNATIPFIWESQPGTPKHPIFCDKNDNIEILPPLTPPPSYTLRASSDYPSEKGRKKIVLRGLVSSIVRRSRSHVTPTWYSSNKLKSNSNSSPMSSWSSASTSSSSARSSPQRKCSKFHKRSFSFSSPMEKLALFNKEEGKNNVNFSSSSMCFGFKKQQGCYSMQDMKNAILFLKKGH